MFVMFYFYEKAFKMFEDVDQQKFFVVKKHFSCKTIRPFFTEAMVNFIKRFILVKCTLT